MDRVRYGLALALLMIVAACGGANVVRLQTATSVAQLAKGVTESTRTYLAHLGERRRQANIALVASDRSCRWGNWINLLVSDGSRPPRPDDPLCIDNPQQAPAGFGTQRLDLRGVPENALKLALAQLGSIAAYHAALTAALDDRPDQLSEDLRFAIDLAATIDTEVATLRDADPQYWTSDRVAAARGLIGLLGTIREEAAQVADVRRIVGEQGDAVTRALAELDERLSRLGSLVDTNSGIIAERALARAYDAEIGQLDFDGRRRFVEAIAAASASADNARGRIGPLRNVIAELRETDADLRRQLAGALNTEERRAAARINRARLLQVLSQLARLIPVTP